MRDKWVRLQSEFRALLNRNTLDPPWADILGIAGGEAGQGYTDCYINVFGNHSYVKGKLESLCREAGNFLPAHLHISVIEDLVIEPPYKEPNIGRWLLYVAHQIPRAVHANGPRVEWLTVPGGHVVPEQTSTSFSGRIYSLVEACDLAVDSVLSGPIPDGQQASPEKAGKGKPAKERKKPGPKKGKHADRDKRIVAKIDGGKRPVDVAHDENLSRSRVTEIYNEAKANGS